MKCQTLSLFSLVHLLKLLTDTVNEKNSMQSMVKKLSMFNIKKRLPMQKSEKNIWHRQNNRGWSAMDGNAQKQQSCLCQLIQYTQLKCINEKINKFVNIFASWSFLFLYYTLTFFTIVIDCMEFVYWYCVKCLWFGTIYQESITLSPDLSSFNSGIYTLVFVNIQGFHISGVPIIGNID